jgi:alkanesulfonate monooxygenase SsuD/methylene tetrahydromethanopterin reductase-like flavin-dependent oxidoreductase (luciferase family)
MDYGHPVKFGVFVTPAAAQPEHALAVAALADEPGFDLVGVQDHPYQSRFLDTWTLLTAMAMRTRRIQVFPDFVNLPLRPPAILAIGGLEDREALRWFASDIVPAVREAVARAR